MPQRFWRFLSGGNVMRAANKKGFFNELSRNRFSYLLILPAMMYVFIFSYATYPYLLIAFQQFNYRKGILGSEWVGLRNFEFFFKSSEAAKIMWNTIYLNLLFIVFGTIFAVAIAVLFNEVRNRLFQKLTQTTMIFPNFLSWQRMACRERSSKQETSGRRRQCAN